MRRFAGLRLSERITDEATTNPESMTPGSTAAMVRDVAAGRGRRPAAAPCNWPMAAGFFLPNAPG